MLVQCGLKVSAMHAKIGLKVIAPRAWSICVGQAGFLEAEWISEAELGVAAERDWCLLLLVLGDFSEHPANCLSSEPASALRCITLRLEGSCGMLGLFG